MSAEAANVTAVALICVRNEALHLQSCVRDFIRQGVDVILIDNDSTDGSTAAIALEFLGRGLLSIERLPWRGAFSLSEQLSLKMKLILTVPHDWVIHADADEWLQAPGEYGNLLEGIRAADEAGFNCINFLEFVFMPRAGEDFEVDDYRARMRHYYFFAPGHPRLMRAWKRSAGFDNRKDGGHSLTGKAMRLFPRDFILRHYIVLSEPQARRKYLGREFAAEDIANDLHGNRRNFNHENLSIKSGLPLLTLDDPQSLAFSMACPMHLHYWDWP